MAVSIQALRNRPNTHKITSQTESTREQFDGIKGEVKGVIEFFTAG
jgi:hypothetical protein